MVLGSDICYLPEHAQNVCSLLKTLRPALSLIAAPTTRGAVYELARLLVAAGATVDEERFTLLDSDDQNPDPTAAKHASHYRILKVRWEDIVN